MPALQYLDDDDLRQQIWSASDELGCSDPFDNKKLVSKILILRQEKAELLGKPDFSEVALSRRMAKCGKNADDFISDLHQKTRPFFTEENKELETFKAEKNGSDVCLLEPWEVGYWAEKVKKERYDFDDEDLRPYFPIQSVLDGMFNLVARVFGLKIVERSTVFEGKTSQQIHSSEQPVEVWHPDVRFYDLFDSASNKLLGSFYADWHPRSSKRAGAWMNYLKTGEPDEKGERPPHLGLICGNLTAPTSTKPALLTHYEVETIFHEFGHLLHHLCGEVPHRSLNGVNVPWDFVELPSQIMENWCWERESLDLFARHHETDAPIPEDLFTKMIRAKNFMAGNAMMRQLAFSKLDLVMHRSLAKDPPEDMEDSLQELLHEYFPKRKTRPRTIAMRFSHLFGNPLGYATAYYSYKWAEVLDADAFTRFQKEGIMNPDTGHAFRECILSKGNSRPADELFHDFMGRPQIPMPYSFEAGSLRPVHKPRHFSLCPLNHKFLPGLPVIAFYVDPATGKHTLLGIFSSLRAKDFPVVHPRMVWFLSFSDLTIGKHKLKMTIGLPMAEEDPRTIINREFESPGPQHRINLINDIHRLKFEEPGNYSILIEIDEQVVLASTFPIIEVKMPS